MTALCCYDSPMEAPGKPSPVYTTDLGTRYLRAPGVQMLARPAFAPRGLEHFLSGFDAAAEMSASLSDPDALPGGTALCKAAGQLCYMSFGPRRTPNAEAERYFANIIASGHGSVLEHAVYSFLIYGVSRSLTHELVRHRAGFAFSQVSQRYVSGAVLRFVERPEFVDDPPLHEAFVRRIDAIAAQYSAMQRDLGEMQKHGDSVLAGQTGTERRKRVQQAARALLPNETEAPIIVSGNVRAWRHFIEARGNSHADIEIRVLASIVLSCLRRAEPILFGDYEETELSDGTVSITTVHRKV